MNVVRIVLIAAVGVAAGFLNTVAGGGSLITMPILIFLGLPSAVANGTNRVAVMSQSVAAVANFRSKGYFDWKLSLLLAVPAAAGAIVGSGIAVSLPDDIFNKALAVVMLIVLALIVWNPQKRQKKERETVGTKEKVIGMIVFFGVGVYGGFIQAGVGFIMIAALTFLTGHSLARINSMKVFIVAVYMLFSLVVFILSGMVDWVLGLSLAFGNRIGGYLGSNFSVKKGDRWIKAVLIAAVVAMSLKLLGIINL
jgi:uncharacterized membrane protein YfcA